MIQLKKDLVLTKGDLNRARALMNIGRMTIYRMIYAWDLWPLVNELRRKKLEKTQVEANGLLQQTHLALKGNCDGT